MKKTQAALALAAALSFAGAASAQVIHQEDFDAGETSGWTVNGNTFLFFDENPGQFIGIPLYDTWGVTLANSENTVLLGNLARHGGELEFTVDIRTFNLMNWWQEQMPPEWFPITLQLVSNLEGPNGQVSVFFVGEGLPDIESGWTRYTFVIPDPTSATLPDGWGGTGDEDPATYEPALPPGVTYSSVLQNIVEFRLTTLQPGYVYAANFWELGFDNVQVSVNPIGGSCPADWNGDTLVNSGDITAFLTDWLASVQDGTLVGDFNGDSAVNSADITAFLTAWLDGVQHGC